MQNWDSLQPANYEHNWYGTMFQTIKAEPLPPPAQTSQLEHYLNMKQSQSMEISSITSSPRTDGSGEGQSFFENGITTMNNHHHPLGFNPLTPPGLPNAVLPPISHFHHANIHTHAQQTQPSQPSPQPSPQESISKLDSQSLTPRNTPPMDVTPPKSPKIYNDYIEKDHDLVSNSSEETKFIESEDDESIRMPIYNSHGKMKNYKCKTCGFLAITKVSFWNHARTHMKPEKILQCPKCPFVTELKHHLEYHIRKHKNLKPFQCDKCNYSCVNKSMLNSHRKSHSSVYQYRCTDCDYATKYCHSFKLHLRKYDHKPGLVLDEDGLPNPAVVIDVYGTRRGPKMKSTQGRHKKSSSEKRNLNAPSSRLSKSLQGQLHQLTSPAKSSTSSSLELPPMSPTTPSMPANYANAVQQQQQKQSLPPMSNILPPLASILQQGRNMSFFPYWNLNLQMLAAQQHAVLSQLSPRMRESALQSLNNNNNNNNGYMMNSTQDIDEKNSLRNFEQEEEEEEINRISHGSAMDLSQTTPTKNTTEGHVTIIKEETVNTPTVSSSNLNCSKRKGRILKLDSILQFQNSQINQDESKQNGVICRLVNGDVTVKTDPQRSIESPSSSSLDEPKLPITLDFTKEEESIDSNTQSTVQSEPIIIPPATTTTTNTTSITNNNNNTSNAQPATSIFECKYCDIYFKDAVLYTIHMGYHSCDDVFKCNMCGEKCDGPVGLFVHMARNAHS